MPDLPVMCGSLSITANPSPGCCSSSAKLHNNPSSCALPYLPTTAAVLSSHPFTSAAYLRSLLLPCSPSSVVYLAFCPFLLFYYLRPCHLTCLPTTSSISITGFHVSELPSFAFHYFIIFATTTTATLLLPTLPIHSIKRQLFLLLRRTLVSFSLSSQPSPCPY